MGTYLQKIAAGHGWLTEAAAGPLPTPMRSNPRYLRTLEEAIAPDDAREIMELAKTMGVSYRQLIRELIWAMVTCHLDISFPMVKMSQYNAAPAREHYMAVKNIFCYLRATIDDEIYFWCWVPVNDLPIGTLP